MLGNNTITHCAYFNLYVATKSGLPHGFGSVGNGKSVTVEQRCSSTLFISLLSMGITASSIVLFVCIASRTHAGFIVIVIFVVVVLYFTIVVVCCVKVW